MRVVCQRSPNKVLIRDGKTACLAGLDDAISREYLGPMADKPKKKPATAPNIKTRADDARGAPKGRFGQPAFVPTEDQREKVRTYAKVFPVHGEHYIARLIGVSRDTLRRHFAEDMELGRAQMLAGIGSQMINRAQNADAETAKGDLDAQKFILARLGGWTTKVEIGDRAREPFGGPGPDLSRLSHEELLEYGRLSAIAEGLDPEEVLGGTDE